MGSFLKQRCQSNYFVTLFTPGISQLWTRINYSWNIFQIIIISHYFIYWQLEKWFNKPVPFLYGHLLIQPYFNWFNCISEVYYETFFFHGIVCYVGPFPLFFLLFNFKPESRKMSSLTSSMFWVPAELFPWRRHALSVSSLCVQTCPLLPRLVKLCRLQLWLQLNLS